MIGPSERTTLLELAASDDASFVELAKIARLDPMTAFRGADLRGVDFDGCDLEGFDFTEADLSGASFRGASLKGIILDGALLTRASGLGSTPASVGFPIAPVLNAVQLDILDAMTRDLDERGRALALMPTGTGRGGVMMELIARTVRGGDRAALITTSAAERDAIIADMRERLPGETVFSTKDANAHPGWRGLVVHNASPYDNAFRSLLDATGSNLNYLFCTSIEPLHRFTRAAEGTIEFVRTATFDMPLIEDGGPDAERLARLVAKLFGTPTFEIQIEQALQVGMLRQARIVQPFEQRTVPGQRTMFSSGLRPETGEDLYRALEPISQDLMDAGRAMRMGSLLVLCRDLPQAQAVHFILRQRWGDMVDVRKATQRWPAGRIVDELEFHRGVLVAPVSRQSIDAARVVSNVAILTPMRLAAAQEIAFRSPRTFRLGDFPIVLDFADAFSGFPNVEVGLPSI